MLNHSTTLMQHAAICPPHLSRFTDVLPLTKAALPCALQAARIKVTAPGFFIASAAPPATEAVRAFDQMVSSLQLASAGSSLYIHGVCAVLQSLSDGEAALSPVLRQA